MDPAAASFCSLLGRLYYLPASFSFLREFSFSLILYWPMSQCSEKARATKEYYVRERWYNASVQTRGLVWEDRVRAQAGVFKAKELISFFLNCLYLSHGHASGLHKFELCCKHLESYGKYTRQLFSLTPTKPKIQKFWNEDCGFVFLTSATWCYHDLEHSAIVRSL